MGGGAAAMLFLATRVLLRFACWHRQRRFSFDGSGSSRNLTPALSPLGALRAKSVVADAVVRDSIVTSCVK